MGKEDNPEALNTASAKAENEASGGSAGAQQNAAPAFGKDDIVTQKQFANEGLGYARDVEVTNGRWAMLG